MNMIVEQIKNDVNLDSIDFDNGLIKSQVKDAYYNQVKRLSSTKSIQIDGKTIGFYELTISTIKDPCEQECNDTYSAIVLKYIYIEPKYRRCGLGSAIIKDIILLLINCLRLQECVL